MVRVSELGRRFSCVESGSSGVHTPVVCTQENDERRRLRLRISLRVQLYTVFFLFEVHDDNVPSGRTANGYSEGDSVR